MNERKIMVEVTEEELQLLKVGITKEMVYDFLVKNMEDRKVFDNPFNAANSFHEKNSITGKLTTKKGTIFLTMKEESREYESNIN